jgi:hypothetical protein
VRDKRCLTLDRQAVVAKAREYGLKVAQSVRQKH